MCPICRSPLKPPESAGTNGATAPARQIVDWSGGSVDDLITLLSGPAWSARVEVFATGSDEPVGEVHVIAGGVSDALYLGSSTHHALEDLRAATAKGGRFRIEPRLPNPADGSLATSGPAQGKLDERPLATLMRYCEDFVLTCGIEVWRGSENAKVDYRRGEIVGVTVGGIDAPERLAEVMKWASGNYRLTVPVLDLPATAPAPAQAAPVKPSGTPAAPRATGSAANKTIFGMPAVDPATLVAPRAKTPTPANGPGQGTAEPSTPTGVAAKAPTVSPPVGASERATETAAASARSTSAAASASPVGGAAVSAPSAPGPAPAAAAAATAPASAPATPSTPGATPPGRPNANRTIFGVAAPSVPVAPPEATTAVATAPAESPRSGAGQVASDGTAEAPAPGKATATAKPASGKGAGANKGAGKAGRAGVTTASGGPPASATAASARDEDRTAPTRPTKEKPGGAPAETAVSTYVGVGFVIGLALLGLYRLVMVFAN
jgi:hypothetical protein